MQIHLTNVTQEYNISTLGLPHKLYRPDVQLSEVDMVCEAILALKAPLNS